MSTIKDFPVNIKDILYSHAGKNAIRFAQKQFFGDPLSNNSPLSCISKPVNPTPKTTSPMKIRKKRAHCYSFCAISRENYEQLKSPSGPKPCVGQYRPNYSVTKTREYSPFFRTKEIQFSVSGQKIMKFDGSPKNKKLTLCNRILYFSLGDHWKHRRELSRDKDEKIQENIETNNRPFSYKIQYRFNKHHIIGDQNSMICEATSPNPHKALHSRVRSIDFNKTMYRTDFCPSRELSPNSSEITIDPSVTLGANKISTRSIHLQNYTMAKVSPRGSIFKISKTPFNYNPNKDIILPKSACCIFRYFLKI